MLNKLNRKNILYCIPDLVEIIDNKQAVELTREEGAESCYGTDVFKGMLYERDNKESRRIFFSMRQSKHLLENCNKRKSD